MQQYIEGDRGRDAQEVRQWAALLRRFPEPATRVAILLQEVPRCQALHRCRLQWWSGASVEQHLVALECALLQQPPQMEQWSDAEMQHCIETLLPAEHFWFDQGGLVGYQSLVLELLHPLQPQDPWEDVSAPPMHRIDQLTPELWAILCKGLEQMNAVVELYPVGGAGDRLGLTCDRTGAPLPQALLAFDHGTLLQGLFEDLLAREWLLYRATGQAVCCPVFLMTSSEKNNHHHILQACSAAAWFGRPKQTVTLVQQPRVPAISSCGDWVQKDPGEVLLKPGGHGVLWRLLEESGALQRYLDAGKRYALVRQINNPLAGQDRTLLALLGICAALEKTMGFASCARVLGAAEGMNVMLQREQEGQAHWYLTNLEYTALKLAGVKETPLRKDRPYSRFPCNTNILCVDLQRVHEQLSPLPIPGLTLNLKEATFSTREGPRTEVIGRLESTMQNLADSLPLVAEALDPEQHPVVLTYHKRESTISVTKKTWDPGASLLETPQGAYYDLLRLRYRNVQEAGWDLPPWNEGDPPPCMLRWHPALGPLDSIVQQRLRSGSLGVGSGLRLEVAEVWVEGLEIQGLLQVIADAPCGRVHHGVRKMSPHCGQVYLQSCKVVNGWRWIKEPYPSVAGQEEGGMGCTFELQGAALLTARNVELAGPQHWVVGDGEHLHLEGGRDGSISERRRSHQMPRWCSELSLQPSGAALSLAPWLEQAMP